MNITFGLLDGGGSTVTVNTIAIVEQIPLSIVSEIVKAESNDNILHAHVHNINDDIEVQ
jgi:hypothetical protein